jgi:ribosomal protein S18 acetylase RimI-like enzyme
MMTAITLRPIAPDDEEFLCRVYGSTREEELALTDWDGAQKAAFVQMQFAAQHRYYQENYRQTTFDVILANGEPAGRLYVARWAKEIRIVDITLLPEYRNAGIGSRLLHDLMTEATTAGKPVSIHVEQYNPALRLYVRLGFVPVGEHGIYLLMKWTPGADGATPT